MSETDPTEAPDERDPLEWVLDRLVYGPYGALAEMTLDPQAAAASGRRRLEQQVRNARFLGEMTVTHGSRELKRRVSEVLGSKGRPPRQDSPGATAAQTSTAPAAGHRQATTTSEEKPAPIDHILEGYDDLSASQVVKLLDALSTDELRDVSRYEQACRGRRTILTKANQLIDRG